MPYNATSHVIVSNLELYSQYIWSDVAICIVQGPFLWGSLFVDFPEVSRSWSWRHIYESFSCGTSWCLFTFAVQYAVKTGKCTYNCIITMNFLTHFTITKFYQCLIIPKSSFCSQNSNVYICQRACVFLVTVWRHTTLRPMLL